MKETLIALVIYSFWAGVAITWGSSSFTVDEIEAQISAQRSE